MSTNSVIGVAVGTGWRGRYVHWDGYPEGVGARVWELIQRDGAVLAVQVLTLEHHGWSQIHRDELGDYDTPSRFAAVPGYGVAYTDDEHPDEWITPDGDTWGTEWAYIVGEGSLMVYKYVYPTKRWEQVDTFPLDGPEPDWEATNAAGYALYPAEVG